jgi:hypothetical protein
MMLTTMQPPDKASWNPRSWTAESHRSMNLDAEDLSVDGVDHSAATG